MDIDRADVLMLSFTDIELINFISTFAFLCRVIS
jgi:hypothetical protein